MAKRREKWGLDEKDWQKTKEARESGLDDAQSAYVDYVMRAVIAELGAMEYADGKYRLAWKNEEDTMYAVNDVLSEVGFFADEYKDFYSPNYCDVKEAIYNRIEEEFPEVDCMLDEHYQSTLEDELIDLANRTKEIKKELKRLNEI